MSNYLILAIMSVTALTIVVCLYRMGQTALKDQGRRIKWSVTVGVVKSELIIEKSGGTRKHSQSSGARLFKTLDLHVNFIDFCNCEDKPR